MATDEALNEYLADLGAPENLQARIASLLRAYSSLLPEPVEAHFVSEYVGQDEARTFESLWLFSRTFVMEAQLLGADEDQFDFVPYRANVRHVVIRKREFDFDATSAASRMSVEVWLADQRYGIFKSTGDNCGALLQILRDYLLPNAAPSSPLTSPA